MQRKDRSRRPSIEGLETRELLSSLYGNPVTTPYTGPHIWAPLPGATSYIKGDKVVAIDQARGNGAETATWTIHGLTPGYYIVLVLYPQHAANAKAVSVNYSTSASTAFQVHVHDD